MKKRIVSGITATGKLTLGNYLGVIKELVKRQEDSELFIFVADLHALTIDISKTELAKNRRDVFALFLACGIDPQKATIFFQSDVSEHSQLTWITESMTTTGELMRMTQYKDKVNKAREANGTVKSKMTLLTYPTLMAADILLYSPDEVPVGADQKQHIELTRNIAARFNNLYGKTFKMPKFVTPKVGSKIMALQSPTKKMAKSDTNAKNTIFLLDEPLVAMKKIKSALTDSESKIYISDTKLGIKNLLTIYAGLENITVDAAANKFANENYGTFKTALAKKIKELLEDIKPRYEEALKNIDKYAKIGSSKAKKIATPHLNSIYKKIGLS